MRRLSSYLIIMVLGFSSAVVAGDIVLRTSVVPEEAWVGQRVILGIEVLSDSGWAQITRFGELDVAGTYVMRTDSQGTRLQETIDGVSYTGQRYELSIYPQRAGAVEIPALSVEVTTRVWGPGATKTAQEATTPATTLLCKVPPGSEDIHGLISTTRLTAKQTWAPKSDNPKVGDAIKRTIEFQAADVSGMAFAPLQHDKIPGLGIYPAEPAVKDTASRGSLSGTRIETVTYVFERPGEVQLPDVRLAWWDIEVGKLKHIELPGPLLQVAAGPAAASGPLAQTGGRQMTLRSWPVLAVLVLVLVLVLQVRNGIRHHWNAWQKQRRESEIMYFRRAIRSLRSGDGRAGVRDTMRWLDRINDNNRPARLDLFLREYADARAQQAAVHLSHSLASGGKIEDAPVLERGLSAARKRWYQFRYPGRHRSAALPGLNRK